MEQLGQYCEGFAALRITARVGSLALGKAGGWFMNADNMPCQFVPQVRISVPVNGACATLLVAEHRRIPAPAIGQGQPGAEALPNLDVFSTLGDEGSVLLAKD